MCNVFSSLTAPVVSAASSPNSVKSGAVSVSVSGINFGANDLSATVLVGGSGCTPLAWKSATGVVCRVAAGFGASVYISAAAEGLVGSVTAIFTYDGHFFLTLVGINGSLLQRLLSHVCCEMCLRLAGRV